MELAVILYCTCLQLFVCGMGPPGGGRNTITGRFTRHLNIVSIESFDDTTMTKIFSSLVDWHFSKGFDGVFTRLGKVSHKLKGWSWDKLQIK